MLWEARELLVAAMDGRKLLTNMTADVLAVFAQAPIDAWIDEGRGPAEYATARADELARLEAGVRQGARREARRHRRGALRAAVRAQRGLGARAARRPARPLPRLPVLGRPALPAPGRLPTPASGTRSTSSG